MMSLKQITVSLVGAGFLLGTGAGVVQRHATTATHRNKAIPALPARTATEHAPAPALPAVKAASAVAAASASWQSDIENRIRAGEYAIREDGESLAASNRAQATSVVWSARGTELTVRSNTSDPDDPSLAAKLRDPRARLESAPKTKPTPSPTLVLHTESIGRAGAEVSAADAPYALGQCRKDGEEDEMGDCLKRAEQSRAGFREWWENTPDGIEQGFDVREAPPRTSADQLLRIRLRVDGARVELADDTRSATLKLRSGPDVSYGKLSARDADGRVLSAHFSPSTGGVAIEVDDTAARYPIVVDPLLTTVRWKAAELNQTGARLGVSIASAGDIDADGYGDVIVGADMYDNGASVDEGRAYLYRGSASGLLAAASWNQGSGHAGSHYGFSVAGAGDVNGDGYGDVIVGASADSSGQAGEGRAYVYYGGTTGLTAGPILEVNQANAAFGWAVASAGDVNGDGYSDVIVGAYAYDNGQTDEGAAFIFHGSAAGLGTAYAQLLQSDQASAYFGISVGGAGDVNGDGYGDVIVGAYFYDHSFTDEGRAFVYLGSKSGVVATARWTGDGGQASAYYGVSVAGVGDVNGDGYGDIVVGAHGFDGSYGAKVDSGKACLYYGGPSGPAMGTADWTLESTQASAYLGLSVASAGDANGDGYADVLVGAPGYDDGTIVDAGKAGVYFGGPNNLAISAGWTVFGTTASEDVGWSVASAGDVNGDGYDDPAIGAPGYSNGQATEGIARVYHGGADGISGTPGTTVQSDQSGGYFGLSVAGAGDVNGDGYGDVIIGAPFYGSQAGRAFAYYGSPSGIGTTAAWSHAGGTGTIDVGSMVASAGDVNGDGYADVFVGARISSVWTIGLYLGSTTGLGSAPVWNSSIPVATGIEAHGVGDLNGDGYGDVIAWTSFAGGPVGVFYGSASAVPLGSTPARVLSVHDGGRAGDVNGDGYDDLIAGDGLGHAFIYNGGPSGIGPNPTTQINGGPTLPTFGEFVGGAGDVNGDGYADVFATTYGGSSRCYVLVGSATGVQTSLGWSAPGASCAGAGDVNGDGYADLVLGDGQDHASGSAPPTSAHGFVSVYTGGSAGLSTTPTSGATSAVGGDGLGFIVDGAGDLNGDGYSDVIAGAPFSVGTAAVFYGNTVQSDHGIPIGLEALRESPRVVIPPGGRSFSNFDFLAGFAHARGPQGRTRLRLQTEDKAHGTAFNAALLTSTAYVDSTSAGTSMQNYITPSGSGTAPHWRARLAYKPGSNLPWFQRSRWVYGGRLGEPRGVHVRVLP